MLDFDFLTAGAYFLAQVAAYLFGGIPFGLLVARWFAGIDIREKGSGNIGATNVGRVLGFRFFLLVFALDFFKGAVPVLIAQAVQRANATPTADGFEICLFLPELVGFAAILGHVFPIYLGFKGGKGVATSLGVVACLLSWPALEAFIVWVGVLLMFRMVSAASVAAAAALLSGYFYAQSAPFAARQLPLTIFAFAAVGLVVVRHRENIARIIAGTEPKVSMPWSKRPPPTETP